MRVAHRRSPVGPCAPILAVLAGPAILAESAALAESLGAPGPPRPAAECGSAPARMEILAGLGRRGELVLASGGRAVLDGVHWPEPAPLAAAAEAWLLEYRGRSLSLVARGETDRWGRAHVDATVEGAGIGAAEGRAGTDVTDLAGGLVAAGLVPVDAGERDTLCRPGLLAVETGARRARRGLWGATGPEVRDGAGLRARMGQFVVAQGAVLRVGERPRRTYLDFARKGEDGLTVTVSKRTWRRLQERGLTAANLAGREVRVRGRLEAWRGPTLDVASADMIEVLDGERAPRR